MSTPSPEKDSLLGPTVHKKIEYQNLKGDVFFAGPFNRLLVASDFINVLIIATNWRISYYDP